MKTIRSKTVAWLVILLGVLIVAFSQKIVFPVLAEVVGIETIVGKQNVVYQADGSYVFTNPSGMVRWTASVAAGGAFIGSLGIWLLQRTRRIEQSS